MNLGKSIIAVDGYSSTGKSSFAREVARRFGLLYLDSGAMYRTVTLFAMEGGFVDGGTVDDGLEAVLPQLDLRFGEESRAMIGDRDVEREIRSMEVSSNVSLIASKQYVRDFVDVRLRQFGRAGGVVMDGRDIGTTVFPDADIKIFMTASEEVRTDRRYRELLAKGQQPTMQEVKENIRHRDELDSSRAISPLKRAADAFLLDNSEMTMEDELIWLKGLAQGRLGIFE